MVRRFRVPVNEADAQQRPKAIMVKPNRWQFGWADMIASRFSFSEREMLE
jgi:hypothetical protein